MILNHQSLLRHRSCNVLSLVEINDLETEFWLIQYGVSAVAQSPNSLLAWATSGGFHPFQLIRQVMLSMDYIFKLCLEVEKHMSQWGKKQQQQQQTTTLLCSVNHLEQYSKCLFLSSPMFRMKFSCGISAGWLDSIQRCNLLLAFPFRAGFET